MNSLHAPSLPDTFALHEGELVALQVRTALALGLSEPNFHDRLADGGAAPEVAVIPAGSFEYGAASGEIAPAHDRPRRAAFIERSFALGVHPVTTSDFERFAMATGWRPRPELVWLSGQQPVINVRCSEALDYCTWLSQETGHSYRLPSELEWEYACRAGAACAYPQGERITPAQALYNPGRDGTQRPTPLKALSRCFARSGAADVGKLPPNRWGLHDMAGNVWEFTASPWTRDHASRPERPREGEPQAVVTKGGSWFDGPSDCRAAARRRRLENELDINLGFRVLREL